MALQNLSSTSQISRGHAAEAELAASRHSVLFIDDEILPTDALVRLLSIDGFQVACSQTGASGFARALAERWDAIVLDLHLPDILGLTVLSDLRKRGLTTPVLVITGWYLDDGHDSAAAALGAAGFLRKPLLADELGRALRSTIRAVHDFVRERPTPPEGPSAGGDETRPQMRAHRRPDDEGVLSSLHARAAAGDGAALDQLCERLLPLLERSIGRKKSHGRSEWVHDAVQDAVIEFRAHVERFDPSRNVPLTSFLRTAAHRNLLNRIDAERRRTVREVQATGRTIGRQLATGIPRYERHLDLIAALSAVWPGLTSIERRVLRLVLQGQRRTRALAQAAGVEDLGVEEQRRAARRITNRIFQRLRRLKR